MDNTPQSQFGLLEAIASSNDEFRKAGYKKVLEIGATKCGQTHGFSGKRFSGDKK